MLTCQEIIDFLWMYDAEELEPERRERFDEHLAVCPDCVRYLDTYRETIRLTADSGADDAELPEAAPEDLVQAILGALSDSPHRQ